MKYYPQYKQLVDTKAVLLVDTREQQNERYHERMELFKSLPNFGGRIERHKLEVGDYALYLEAPSGIIVDAGRMADGAAGERKMDLEEFLYGLGTDRERLKKELIKAKEIGCKLYFAVESGSYKDIVEHKYKSGITPKQAIGTYRAFKNRYGMDVEYVTPETFPGYIYGMLHEHLFNYIQQAYPNGELL